MLNNNPNEQSSNDMTVLLEALTLQIELQQAREAVMDKLSNNRPRSIVRPQQHADEQFQDHSFDHFVDYRSMSEFESH